LRYGTPSPGVLITNKELQEIVTILDMDESPEEDKLTVTQARKIQNCSSQTFYTAEAFPGRKPNMFRPKKPFAGHHGFQWRSESHFRKRFFYEGQH
jgi:F0F1-type ATP synthase beta subunit